MAQSPDPHAEHAPEAPVHKAPAARQAHAHGVSLNRLAFTATLHCLSGCAVGEVLGIVIGTALGWAALPTIGLAVGLAFVFGYAFTMVPLLRAGVKKSLTDALAGLGRAVERPAAGTGL